MNQTRRAKHLHRSAAALFAASLMGCAGMQNPTYGPLGGPGLQLDQYSQKWVLNGEPFTPGGLGAGVLTSMMTGVSSVAWLRGTFDQAGRNASVHLFIKYEGKGAGGLIAQAASDSTGKALQVKRIEQSFTRTTLGVTAIAPLEIISVETPRDYLESRKSTGMDIQIRGYNGQASVINVSAESIAQYVSEFDAAISKVRK